MIPCCSSSNASLLRDLEWESKEDFFIGVHCTTPLKIPSIVLYPEATQ